MTAEPLDLAAIKADDWSSVRERDSEAMAGPAKDQLVYRERRALLVEVDRLTAELAAAQEQLQRVARETLTEAADRVAPFSGIGMANGATRAQVSKWLRDRATLAGASEPSPFAHPFWGKVYSTTEEKTRLAGEGE